MAAIFAKMKIFEIFLKNHISRAFSKKFKPYFLILASWTKTYMYKKNVVLAGGGQILPPPPRGNERPVGNRVNFFVVPFFFPFVSFKSVVHLKCHGASKMSESFFGIFQGFFKDV